MAKEKTKLSEKIGKVTKLPSKKDDMTSKKALAKLNKKMNIEVKNAEHQAKRSLVKEKINENYYRDIELAQEWLLRELIKREMAKRNFKDFVAYVKPDFTFSEFNLDLIENLQNVYEWKLEKLIVNMPPRHWKTLLVNILFPAFVLWNRPYEQFVNVWYNFWLPAETSAETLRLVKSELYKNVFPDFNLDPTKQKSNEWKVTFWEVQSGWYYWVWVWGWLTWRWFTYWIIDDPYAWRQAAESVAIWKQVIDWYTSTFSTRYNPHFDWRRWHKWAVIIVMTRWTVNDLVWWIEETHWNWPTVKYPAIAEDWSILFPEKFTLEFYMSKKQESVRDFEAVYQQNPIKSMWALFTKEMFRYFYRSDLEREDQLNMKNFVWWLFIDPAWSSNKSSDDIVAMVVWKNKHTKEYYVADIIGWKFAPTESFVKIWMALDYWKTMWMQIRFISIEQVSINKDQTLFKKNFVEWLRQNDKVYSMYDYCPRENKQDRIKWTLEPRLMNGLIHFVNKKDSGWNDWFRVLEEELQKFPWMAYDDFPDALTQACIMLDDKSWIELQKEENNKWYDWERERDYYLDPMTHEKVYY